MAKILSQDEIDALLTTVASGDEDISIDEPEIDHQLRPVVAYDFKHPNRVSKDQIRTMENLHDNFAGHFGSSLSAVMRAVVDVELVSVDQITYSEFVLSLTVPSCIFTFTAEPMEGACVLDFSPSLTFAFVERIFGGQGKAMEAERELTLIERSVMGRIVRQLYEDLATSWEHIVPIVAKQVSYESSPQFVQIVPPGETVVVVSFQLKLFSTSGLLSICYPYVTLETIISKLSAQNWIDSTKKKSGRDDRLLNQENLQSVQADITAMLGMTEISIKEFLKIQIGDIIPVDVKINEPLQMLVSGKSKFSAHPGISGRKKACQVMEVFDNTKRRLMNA